MIWDEKTGHKAGLGSRSSGLGLYLRFPGRETLSTHCPVNLYCCRTTQASNMEELIVWLKNQFGSHFRHVFKFLSFGIKWNLEKGIIWSLHNNKLSTITYHCEYEVWTRNYFNHCIRWTISLLTNDAEENLNLNFTLSYIFYNHVRII